MKRPRRKLREKGFMHHTDRRKEKKKKKEKDGPKSLFKLRKKNKS